MGIAGLWKMVQSRSSEVNPRTVFPPGTVFYLDASVTIHSLLSRHYVDIMVDGRYAEFVADWRVEMRRFKEWAGGKGTHVIVYDGVRIPLKRVNKARENARKAAADAATDDALSAKTRMRIAVHGRAVDVVPLCVKCCEDKGMACVMAPCEAEAQATYLAMTRRPSQGVVVTLEFGSCGQYVG